ncbi:MAG: hypothetical protein AB7F86_10515 [Bdellovibrionales bacterium]
MFLTYLYQADDLVKFFKVLQISALAAAVGYFFVRAWSSYLPLKVMILLAVLLDFLVSTTSVRTLFSNAVPHGSKMASDRTEFWTGGMDAPMFGNQKLRLPELISQDFNFVGTPYELCVRRSVAKYADCPKRKSDGELSSWTLFYLTKEFYQLFANEAQYTKAVSAIRGSFTDKAFSDIREGFRLEPICSRDGYIYWDISGDNVRVRIAGRRAEAIVLPWLKNRMDVESDSPSLLLRQTETGLISVHSDGRPSEIYLKSGDSWFWRFSILMFWSPMVLLGLVIFNDLLKWAGLSKAGRIRPFFRQRSRRPVRSERIIEI